MFLLRALVRFDLLPRTLVCSDLLASRLGAHRILMGTPVPYVPGSIFLTSLHLCMFCVLFLHRAFERHDCEVPVARHLCCMVVVRRPGATNQDDPVIR